MYDSNGQILALTFRSKVPKTFQVVIYSLGGGTYRYVDESTFRRVRRRPVLWLRVSDFGFRVSDVGFLVSGFWFRVSRFVFRVLGLEFRVESLGFGFSGWGLRVEGFGFRVEGSDLHVKVSSTGSPTTTVRSCRPVRVSAEVTVVHLGWSTCHAISGRGG
jgi:hypothetical protein